MSKLVRIILGLAGVLAVIAGIAVWLLVSNLDSKLTLRVGAVDTPSVTA